MQNAKLFIRTILLKSYLKLNSMPTCVRHCLRSQKKGSIDVQNNKRPKSKFHPNKRPRYDEDQVLEGTTADSVSNHAEDDNQVVTL